MVSPDLVGWIGTAIMAWGSVGIAHKRVEGLALMFLGNVLFAIMGAMAGLYSLIGVSIVMGALDLYAIHRWLK